MRRSHKALGAVAVMGAAAIFVDRAVIGHADAGSPTPGAASATPGASGAQRESPVAGATAALDSLRGVDQDSLAARLERIAPREGPIGVLFSAAGLGWEAPALGVADDGGTGAGVDRAPGEGAPSLKVTSVSLGSSPMAVFEGTGPTRVGDAIGGGWTIARIDRGGVTIRRGDRTHTYPLPGAGLVHAELGRSDR